MLCMYVNCMLGKKIETWWQSMRMDFVCLCHKVQMMENSGSGAVKLTALQQYKVTRLNFLIPHCKKPHHMKEMGLEPSQKSTVDSDKSMEVEESPMAFTCR